MNEEQESGGEYRHTYTHIRTLEGGDDDDEDDDEAEGVMADVFWRALCLAFAVACLVALFLRKGSWKRESKETREK